MPRQFLIFARPLMLNSDPSYDLTAVQRLLSTNAPLSMVGLATSAEHAALTATLQEHTDTVRSFRESDPEALLWAAKHQTSIVPFRFDKSGTLHCGSPVTPVQISKVGDPSSAQARLRARCLAYADSEQAAVPSMPNAGRDSVTPAVVGVGEGVLRELAELKASGKRLIQQAPLEVFLFQGREAPELLHELGIQRQRAFSAVGAGVDSTVDLIPADEYYHHLVIWDEKMHRLVGAYRVGFTDRILAEHEHDALYMNQVFEISPAFHDRIGPSLELSRSIVVPEYQRDPRMLALLWRGLGEIVRRDPRYTTCFGSPTVSSFYSPLSLAVISTFLKRHHSDDTALCALVSERNPFQPTTKHHEAIVDAFAREDLGALKALIEAIEEGQRTIPPLIRYYLNLGGKFLGFHVEAAFNHTLFCLMRVDLRRTEPRILKRFLQDIPAEFQQGGPSQV